MSDCLASGLESAIPLLLREIHTLADVGKITIAFPDEGAFKRFNTMFDSFETITCTKIRDGKKRIVRVKEGDAEGRHIIIVDDLVQTGGTLKNCAKALLERGAIGISAYVTHAVFPQDSWKKFVDSEVKFTNFWITDSIPHSKEIAKNPPFKMLSLCDSISDALLGFDLLQA
ncbi:uncharacterized protein LOC102808426 [Saccoglossus kowalevskii]|uniref:Ribose-phosphate pyrophosphokinase 4-like n=1 Tax=Saccoglossus kowalevskii TaxID=10224 RepID=A0ABM0MHI4_SACKO|nr:PREDICTED: ribose-phosphate pyrophosphokinase 4-like [Saccoglossus kowalevskii]